MLLPYLLILLILQNVKICNTSRYGQVASCGLFIFKTKLPAYLSMLIRFVIIVDVHCAQSQKYDKRAEHDTRKSLPLARDNALMCQRVCVCAWKCTMFVLYIVYYCCTMKHERIVQLPQKSPKQLYLQLFGISIKSGKTLRYRMQKGARRASRRGCAAWIIYSLYIIDHTV